MACTPWYLDVWKLLNNWLMNYEECISWLEKEIAKEDVRVNNGETKTGIRRWVLSIMKNMVLYNSELKNEILDEVRKKCNKNKV